MKFKTEVRVAVGKPFEYTSHWFEGTLEEVREEEELVRASYPMIVPIDERFDSILQAYIKDPKTMNKETYDSLNASQQHIISTIKAARSVGIPAGKQ